MTTIKYLATHYKSRQNIFREIRGLIFLICLFFLSFGVNASLPIADATVPPSYTQADVVLLIVFVLLALIVSFLCSVAEAVLLSMTPAYIVGLAENDPPKYSLLKKLKQDNVDRSLAAILTLNTIAHTVGAIGSGAKATVVFGSAWFGLFSAIMTLLILFLSEIIPKTLGAVYWRSLSGVTAKFINYMILILYPLILLSELITKWIAKGKSPHVFHHDEFIAMVDVGEQAGKINARESRIIRNLFKFGSLMANDIMTPRTVMVAFSEEIKIADAVVGKNVAPFSRLPLYKERLDHVTGFVLKDDLLLAKAKGNDQESLISLKREILVVKDNDTLSELLDKLLQNRAHIATVVGEYGETVGLVTLEDVVETLLGMEIVDEMDQVIDMRALARKQWEKRAKARGIQT